MATLDDAAAIALSLPEVTETLRWGNRTWLVRGKGFAWERPLSKADVRRLGKQPLPEGELLAVKVADMEDKQAVLAMNPGTMFDIEHFSGFAAVLVKLELVDLRQLREAVVDGWLACAPPSLAKDFLGHEGTE